MEESAPEDLKRVWRQNEIPVIVRKGSGWKLNVKVPGFTEGLEWYHTERAFLQSVRPNGNEPVWQRRFSAWSLPHSWFNDLVPRLLKRFCSLYIIQPYRPQKKCAPKCMTATGHDCECSCMGANHGAGGPDAGWFVVSDTFATSWGESQLACRLMKARDQS